MLGWALTSTSALVAYLQLVKEVYELFTGTGLLAEADEDRLFFEAHKNDTTPQALAFRFRALAVASDPLAAEFRDPELWVSLRALARSHGQLTRWQGMAASLGSLGGPDWADLSAQEQREVRAFARHLARYHASWVRRGRAKQGALDTALSGLAEIYVRHAGLQRHPHEVPHAEASTFISFCAVALTGVVPLWSRTPKALARRWRRLKGLHRDGLPAKGPLKRRRRARASAPLRLK